MGAPAHYSACGLSGRCWFGDSIALNGACMTVTSMDAALPQFTIDISAESLQRPRADAPAPSTWKALRAHDRGGGTWCQAMWTALAKSRTSPRWARAGNCAYWPVTLHATCLQGFDHHQRREPDRQPHCRRGTGPGEASINLIPHTVQNTALGHLRAGSKVNLEIDLIARTRRMMDVPAPAQ